MGIVYALISMAFAGLNDFLFKRYTARPQPQLGLFMAGVGLVWTALCALGLWRWPTPIAAAYWPVMLGAGVCSFVANALFIRSYRVFPAGAGATVFRLNLVLVVLISVLWLGEPLTPWKLVGVLLGIIAIIALGMQATGGTATRATAQGALLLAAACLCRAGMGVLYKVAGSQGVPAFALLTVNGACWLLGGLLYAWWRREAWAAVRPTAARLALASGVLVVGITFFMQAATRIADASLVIPVTQMSFVVTGALGVALLREPVTRHTAWALLAAIGCIVSMSRG